MNTSTVTIVKNGNAANYRLTEFHIHSPSEHKINGRQFDAEMHFSYVLTGGQRPAGDNRDQIRLAVMFNYQEGQENQFLNEWNVDRDKNSYVELSLGYFQDLIDQGVLDEYYYYEGSTSAPPCTEAHNWIIFKNVLGMSRAQLQGLKKNLELDMSFAGGRGNNRVVQPLNCRMVGSSALSECRRPL